MFIFHTTYTNVFSNSILPHCCLTLNYFNCYNSSMNHSRGTKKQRSVTFTFSHVKLGSFTREDMREKSYKQDQFHCDNNKIQQPPENYKKKYIVKVKYSSCHCKNVMATSRVLGLRKTAKVCTALVSALKASGNTRDRDQCSVYTAMLHPSC